MRIGSLCSGYGGLDLAAELIWPRSELWWWSEIDDAACTVMNARFDAPNIGDLTNPHISPEPVDVLTAGFPCQPFSQAGQRKGTEDDRWIWDDIAALIGRMEAPPSMLLLENVPGLLTANNGDAMARVIHDLAKLGYLGSYRTATAADVGAPHLRRRVFILATLADPSRGRVGPFRLARRGDEPSGDRPERPPVSPEPEVAHPTDPVQSRVSVGRLLPTPVASDAHGSRRDTARTEEWTSNPGTSLLDALRMIPTDSIFGVYTPAVRRAMELTRPVPHPVDHKDRINPRFAEWMMMLPDGWVTDPDLPLTRTARLRLLGNGVVPSQAAAAFHSLLKGT